MINKFFKTTLRNLCRNKTNSFLNIFGLSIGISCAGLIFLWVENEMNYDTFNIKKEQLYLGRINEHLDAGVFTHSSTPGVLAPAIQAEIPGIANTCRATDYQTSLLFNIENKSVYASGKYAEASLFNMFTLPFIQGSSETAFSELYSLVITEKTAKKFFGNSNNVVGKTVRIDNKQDYVITGVIKDIPENSSLQFEWLAPFQIWQQERPWSLKWGNNCISTYVELKLGTDETVVNKLLYDFVQKRMPASVSHVFLFAMNDWHLHDQFENGKKTDGGQIEYVRLFSIIGCIILFIACINFMNLSTARSEKRAREVGIRKVLGAGKGKLISQFIGEALFMSMIAAIAAVIIMSLILPAFNTVVQKNLSLGLDNLLHISILLIIALICGLISGSYPSFYLSSFNPVFVLKGLKLKNGSAVFIRKGLVVLQFTISIVLIVSTIIIYQQIQHVKARDLGFNKNNLLAMDVVGDMGKSFPVIKQDLLNTGLVENVALSDHATIYGGNNTNEFSWEGKAPNAKILVSTRGVSPEFISTSAMQLISGRDFKVTDSINFDLPPQNLNVIITQSMEKVMGTGSAIGKIIKSGNDSARATVIGVVKDYVYGNMYGKPDPVVFLCVPARHETQMYVRIKAQSNTEQALAGIEGVMKKNNPEYPFSYLFVDDQFNAMFTNEKLMGKLSRVFAALAIIISCLGLFGLAAYTAERRTKEIGIRKVLGASVAGLTGLLSKDFLKLVGISCLIAFPAGWWIMHNWLNRYTYRIDINWWIFFISGAIAVFIALLAISYQSIKAAIANPVKSLRTE